MNYNYYEDEEDDFFDFYSNNHLLSIVLGATFAFLLIQVAKEITVLLPTMQIDKNDTFFIASLLFCLFSFISIVNIVFSIKKYIFSQRAIRSSLSMKYCNELRTLKTDKISESIMNKVISSFDTAKLKYIEFRDVSLICSFFNNEKRKIQETISKKSGVLKQIFQILTTGTSITISLLLANNFSKEMLRFNLLILAILLIIFFAVIVIPNPLRKIKYRKKLEAKFELVKRLNEEIEIQERKILNKE